LLYLENEVLYSYAVCYARHSNNIYARICSSEVWYVDCFLTCVAFKSNWNNTCNSTLL